MSVSLQGSLLVATPMLRDPNFHQTVVLVCEHDAEGALGLVLNRPSGAPVADFLVEWAEAVPEPDVVFVGGPVAPEVAVGLAATDTGEMLVGWTEVASGLGLIDLAQPADLARPVVDRLRVYSGYSGWGAGQLDVEIANDDWFTVALEGEDPFHPDAIGLWRRVLRRQSGSLSWYATFPPDPALN